MERNTLWRWGIGLGKYSALAVPQSAIPAVAVVSNVIDV